MGDITSTRRQYGDLSPYLIAARRRSLTGKQATILVTKEFFSSSGTAQKTVLL
jgi:hypothetical protein